MIEIVCWVAAFAGAYALGCWMERHKRHGRARRHDLHRMERRAYGDVSQPDSHGRWTPR